MKFEKLYYDPKSPAGYAGEQALYQLAKKSSKKVKLDDVRNWLRKQQTYTLHRQIRRKFLRRKTVVAGIDYQWQADLADMSKMSKVNDKYRYLLCFIDVFSKFAWVVPIKNKTGKTLVDAFKSVLKSGRSRKSLQTDKGTEFKNKDFQNFLKSKKIHFNLQPKIPKPKPVLSNVLKELWKVVRGNTSHIVALCDMLTFYQR